jgi:tripartite-type tricarboxylate transporter receptor subunit TctC
MRMREIRVVAGVAVFLAGTATAQTFPSKPVRIIVAFPAGGGTDITARVIGPKLTEIWGHQVLVDNRPGASGTIGTEQAARSAPDGHTLFMGTMGNLSVNKYLFPKLALDPLAIWSGDASCRGAFVMVAHRRCQRRTSRS